MIAMLRHLFSTAPEPIKAHGPCRHPYDPDNEDGYRCRCHRRMGNDFWFLPADRCLFEKRVHKFQSNGERA